MKLPEVLESRINKSGPNGCWIWTGFIGSNGYGSIRIKTKTHWAHRIVYQKLKGEIPDGLELDHLCRTRSCVNPDHLEAVTKKVNCERGMIGKYDSNGDWQRSKTHCPAGHPYDEDNTYVHGGGKFRRCRECNRINAQKYRKRKSDERRANKPTK